MIKKPLILYVLSMFFYSGLYAETLTVHINNIEHNEGAIMVALHDGAKDYPIKRVPIATQSVPANKAGVVVSFENLSAGTYAIALYHDENSNGKMDQNFIGIPKEGMGASNNAKGRMGPPKFKDAAVVIDDIDIDIEISVNY